MPELPPPLPPGDRTVGQLIAETIRLYGDNFWRALPLGLPIALLDQLDLGRGGGGRIALFVACAPFLAFAFAYACAVAGKVQPDMRTLATATAIGTLVLLPASLVFTWFALIAAVYLSFVGLSVPAAVLEGTGLRASLRRSGCARWRSIRTFPTRISRSAAPHAFTRSTRSSRRATSSRCTYP